MKCEDLITDEAIKIVFGNSNFGEKTPRQVIKQALLKIASGYSNGSTSQSVLENLGLARDNSLTKLGKTYLYYAYADE